MYRILILSFFMISVVHADPPQSTFVFPAGGKRGTEVNFWVGGLNLNQECQMEMTGLGIDYTTKLTRTQTPWFEGPVLPLPESQRQENYPRVMQARANIGAKSPLGDRFIFLRTSQGYTLPQRFVVGDYPEIIEQESDAEDLPVQVQLPVTVNGRIFPREDVDRWQVTLNAQQRISVSVDSDRLGYPLEAKITLTDPNGEIIAESVNRGNRDPKLSVITKSAGLHTVTITDARGDGGPGYVYRLSLTTEELPRVHNPAFPSIPTKTASENPDPVRGNLLTIPGVGLGTIKRPGHQDRWSIVGQKSQPLEIQLKARSINSALLGKISVLDASSKELVVAEPSTDPDPVLKWTPPNDGIYQIVIADLFPKRGGADFYYQLHIRPSVDDFELSFTVPSLNVVRGGESQLQIQIERSGSFRSAVRLKVDGLPPEVTIPDLIEIGAGQANTSIKLKASKEAKVSTSQLVITGTSLVPLHPFTAIPIAVTKRAFWKEDRTIQSVRSMATIPTPFKIAGDYELKLIPRGTVYVRKYHIERNGFTGPIEIELAEHQARHLQGVTGPKLTVPGDRSDFEYPLTLPPWMETGRTSRTCVMGTAQVRDLDGQTHTVNFSSREQNDQIIAVVEPERLSLKVEQLTARLSTGSVKLPFTVRRGIGLTGPVEVSAQFSSTSITASTVVIAANAETGLIEFSSKAAVTKIVPVPVVLRAIIKDGDGRPVVAEQAVTLYLSP